MKTYSRWPALAVAGALLAPASVAYAQQDEKQAPARAASERVVVERTLTVGSSTESTAPKASALVVVRDAETGELRAPTAAEAARLSASLDPLNRSDEGLVRTEYADGTVSVHLAGRFQSLSILERHADGAHDATCTHDATAAADILTAAPAMPEKNAEMNDRASKARAEQ